MRQGMGGGREYAMEIISSHYIAYTFMNHNKNTVENIAYILSEGSYVSKCTYVLRNAEKTSLELEKRALEKLKEQMGKVKYGRRKSTTT